MPEWRGLLECNRRLRFGRGWLAGLWLEILFAPEEESGLLRRRVLRSFELEFDLNRPTTRQLVRPSLGRHGSDHCFAIPEGRSDKAA